MNTSNQSLPYVKAKRVHLKKGNNMIPYGFNLRPVMPVGDPNQKMVWEEKVGCWLCGILCAGQLVMTIIMIANKLSQ